MEKKNFEGREEGFLKAGCVASSSGGLIPIV